MRLLCLHKSECIAQDGVFEKAKQAQEEAEQAAKIASANAEKAFRLLSVSETTRKEVEETRARHESTKQKIEDTRIAVSSVTPAYTYYHMSSHQSQTENRLEVSAAAIVEQLSGALADILQQRCK